MIRAAARRSQGALALALTLGCRAAPPEPARASSPPSAATAGSAAPAAPTVAAPAAVAPATLGGLSFESFTVGGHAAARLPLVVALHGLGDSPRGFRGVFDGFVGPARIVVLQAPLPWGGGFSWWAYRPGDQAPAERAHAIGGAATVVARAIDEARERFPTRGAPIVTGFSQGGMLSFALAAHHPASIGEAIPVGGLLPAPLWPARVAAGHGPPRPRVTALHGEADDRVPIGPARETLARLRAAGHEASLASFPGVGHSLPPPVLRALHEALAAAVGRAR